MTAHSTGSTAQVGGPGHQPHRTIKAARTLRGDQTQVELAAALRAETGEDWTRNKVARLERDEKVFDVHTLIALTKIHDLPADFYLFGPGTLPPYSGKARFDTAEVIAFPTASERARRRADSRTPRLAADTS